MFNLHVDVRNNRNVKNNMLQALGRIFLFVGICSLNLMVVCAQVTDERLSPEYLIRESPLQEKRNAFSTYTENTLDTLQFGDETPFFDDFSYQSSIPDSNRWWLRLGVSDYPLLSKDLAINPPSSGVASFDGLNAFGLPYNNQLLESAVADELRSHCIDLSEMTAEDDIVLSFFLQPAGRGNAPESEDAFEVLFTRAGLPLDSLKRMLRVPGNTLSGFRQYVIPVDDPEFFHQQFQLVFRSIGSRNGFLDIWNLDYVFMGTNRSFADTTYQDQAITDARLEIIDPYTAYPLILYPPPENPQSGVKVNVKNQDDQSREVSASVTIQEPDENEIKFSQSFELEPSNSAERQTQLTDVLSPELSRSGNITLSVELASEDANISNNTFVRHVQIDSLLAYDDGEADASYGLTQPKGFGTRFVLPEADAYEMRAVWMSFVPLFNVSQVGNRADYMEGHGFRIVIWNEADTDSILYSEVGGPQVVYGDSLNSFNRFELNRPVILPDTFWVGIVQTDGLPIGVGYDLTIPRNLSFWDSAGVWTPSRLGGTPMIRPEIHTAQIVTSRKQHLSDDSFRLSAYPQPLSGNELFVTLQVPLTGISVQLIDLSGKSVTLGYPQTSYTQELHLKLPDQLPEGIYSIQICGTDRRNEMQVGVQKIMKIP